MKKTSITILALLLLVCIGLAVSAKDISPAIDILRKNTTFTKCALNGTDATFSKDDFIKVAGCDFDYITITKIPPTDEGTLKVSGVAVIEGQCITADSLDLLKFSREEKAEGNNAYFTFMFSDKNWKGTEITCNINYLASVNYAPIVDNFKINTVKNIAVYSEINVYDPDNDELTIKVDAYPSFGTVSINSELQRITYTPEKNFTGNDVFTIYAEDGFGNRSNEATVSVNVLSDSENMTFGDMAGSDIHYAALALSKDNIMTYSKKGGEYYFSPDEAVNKIDFTVMLLSASKLNNGISTVKDTEFIDDADLSSGRKSYLKRALDVEIVEIGDGYFKPADNITVKEARIMVARSLGLDADSKEIDLIMGNATTEKELTKESVAEILYNICLYLD